MKLPFWAKDLADRFWAEAGVPNGWPRPLREALSRTSPLGLLELPALSTGRVRAWLDRCRIPHAVPAADCLLHACLVARAGDGIIFLDADDTEAEQHFSLAHELAHYLRHYQEPRRRAAAELGPDVLTVFDGERPPRPDERLTAILHRLPLGFHTHLLERRSTPGAGSQVEEEADRLAYELLAPARAVAACAPDRATATRQLHAIFGLPESRAAEYAGWLYPEPVRSPVVSWLRKKS